MATREILERATRDPGLSGALTVDPGLTERELAAFVGELGVPLPDSIRELLAYSRGFTVEPFGKVSFTGEGLELGLEELFPRKVPLAANVTGDHWIVDVHRDAGTWGPVFFACHDPPVVVIQAPDLAAFVAQVLEHGRREDGVERVSSDAMSAIWDRRAPLIDVASARESKDAALSSFAGELPESLLIADLRARRPGTGFAWARRADSIPLRNGAELLFAVDDRPLPRSWLGRLLGR